jgi:hypothetical protein
VYDYGVVYKRVIFFSLQEILRVDVNVLDMEGTSWFWSCGSFFMEFFGGKLSLVNIPRMELMKLKRA